MVARKGDALGRSLKNEPDGSYGLCRSNSPPQRYLGGQVGLNAGLCQSASDVSDEEKLSNRGLIGSSWRIRNPPYCIRRCTQVHGYDSPHRKLWIRYRPAPLIMGVSRQEVHIRIIIKTLG